MSNPIYPGVYVQEGPRGMSPITGVSTSVTAFVGTASAGPLAQPVLVQSDADYQRQFGGLDARSEMSYAVLQFFANGGTTAIVVRLAAPGDLPNAGAYLGDRSLREGLYALDAVGLFNLLCLPGVSDPLVLLAAASYAEDRNAFLIVDAPDGNTPDEMVALMSGTGMPRTGFAAVYYPWIQIADPLNGGNPRSVAPSGTIAGLFARTDLTAGVWKAPAGTRWPLAGVTGIDCLLTDAENARLNPIGVNCIRDLPVYGPVCWGARTVLGGEQANSDWKYVPVRRLALYIEQSISTGLAWVAFEPNGPPLWSTICLSVVAFMDGLFRQGAFLGARASDAYFVQCDGATTSPDDIAQGIVNVTVGFAPVRPAEFVILTIQQATAPTAL